MAILAIAGVANAQPVMTNDSVAMGSAYANEIYYSMSNGQVSSHPRNTWDLAFRTFAFSSSIQINDGVGCVLYTYPNSDTSGFATMDTAGLSSWPALYNDPEDWENGAFSRNASGHPNYGWCVYNSITHNLHGDSLYIVKLRDGSFRKIFVYLKESFATTYYFKYANLDGSDYHDVALDCSSYLDKDFLGYDIVGNQSVDFQAPKADWDILFTKYMSVQPNGAPYPVVGVLSNPAIGVTEYHLVDPAYMDWGVNAWDETRQPIGWDWKTFTGTAWALEDSLVYFVRDQIGDVYRLVFNKFGGSGGGKIGFGKALLSTTGIEENMNPNFLELYPNPANSNVNVRFFTENNGAAEVQIFDLLGNVVYQSGIQLNKGVNQFNVGIHDLRSGMYQMQVVSAKVNITKKLIISR